MKSAPRNATFSIFSRHMQVDFRDNDEQVKEYGFDFLTIRLLPVSRLENIRYWRSCLNGQIKHQKSPFWPFRI